MATGAVVVWIAFNEFLPLVWFAVLSLPIPMIGKRSFRRCRLVIMSTLPLASSSMLKRRVVMDWDQPNCGHSERTADQSGQEHNLDSTACHMPQPSPVQREVEDDQDEKQIAVPHVQVAPIMSRPAPDGQAGATTTAWGEAIGQQAPGRRHETE